MNTIQVLLSLATNLGWSLQQFDVQNTFLHGDLEEKIYMKAPSGFSDGFKGYELCKLQKILYGLKYLLEYGLEDLLRLWDTGSFDKIEGIVFSLSKHRQLVKSQPWLFMWII